MLKKYDKTIKNIIAANNQTENWVKVLENHKTMLLQIQHERLIHLLVTIFVGNAMLMCILTMVITLRLYLVYLDFPLLILFVAYIFHYRYLENMTQRWFKYRATIQEKIS